MTHYQPLPNFEGNKQPKLAPYTIFSIKTIARRDPKELCQFDNGHIYFSLPTSVLECRILVRNNQQDKNALTNLSLNSIHSDTSPHKFVDTKDNFLMERITNAQLRFYYRELDLKSGSTTNTKLISKTSKFDHLSSLLGFDLEPFSIIEFNRNYDNMGCILTFNIQMESKKLFSKSKDLIYELGFDFHDHPRPIMRLVHKNNSIVKQCCTLNIFEKAITYLPFCSIYYLEGYNRATTIIDNFLKNYEKEDVFVNEKLKRPYSYILMLHALSIMYSNSGLIICMNNFGNDFFKKINNLYLISKECQTLKQILSLKDKYIEKIFDSIEIIGLYKHPIHPLPIMEYVMKKIEEKRRYLVFLLNYPFDDRNVVQLPLHCNNQLFDIFPNLLSMDNFDNQGNTILGIFHCFIYSVKKTVLKQYENSELFNSIQLNLNSVMKLNDNITNATTLDFEEFEESLINCIEILRGESNVIENETLIKEIILTLIEYPFKISSFDIKDDKLLNIDDWYIEKVLNYIERLKGCILAMYGKVDISIVRVMEFLKTSFETLIIALVFLKDNNNNINYSSSVKLNLLFLTENMIKYIEEIIQSYISIVEIMDIEDKFHCSIESCMEKVLTDLLRNGLNDSEIDSFIHELCLQCTRFHGGKISFSPISNIAALLQEFRIIQIKIKN